MKNILVLGFLLFFTSCGSMPKILTTTSRTTLRSFSEKKLDNGLTVLYVEDASLPYVGFQLMLKTGSSEDPQDYAGLSEMTARMLEKGSKNHNAQQIAAAFAKMGSEFIASVDNDMTLFTASVPSPEGSNAAQLFSEVMTQPAFDTHEIERLRSRMMAEALSVQDDPSTYASQIWEKISYGNHPYAHPTGGTKATLSKIRPRDVNRFYLRNYTPKSAYLAITGQVSAELKKKIESAFSAWSGGQAESAKFSELQTINGRSLQIIQQPGQAVQSQVRIGHYGIKRSDTDFIALRMANTVLGGAFLSRLNDRIRVQLGLTYGIKSNVGYGLDRGLFTISAATKSESTRQLVQESLKIFEQFVANGITPQELDSSKGYLKGVFPSSIESADSFAFNLLALRLYGVPDSYLSTYLSRVDDLTVEGVNQAIKKHFDAKNLRIMIYGNASRLSGEMKDVAPVQVVKTAL